MDFSPVNQQAGAPMEPVPNRSLAEKAALVTGAASGIGAAIARRLAAQGARVVAADINEQGVRAVADAIQAGGGHAIALRLDVTSEADWQTAMTRVLSEWGRLDICVNCAGIAFARPINDLDLADWRRVMQTNLDSAFLGTKHAMATMQPTGGGCIINIASAAGIKPVSGNAAYGTSKAAVRFLTQVAALEGKPHGIRVNSISPGAVATPIWRGTEMWPAETESQVGAAAALDAMATEQGFARPEEIAAAVVFLASEEAQHLTGADLRVDDGFAIS
jgi:3(or 17)beta-hydroxysteroid dehydrogenase